MRKLLTIVLTFLLGFSSAIFGKSVEIFTAANEQRIEKLLAQMTLEEKVGQMTLLTLDVLFAGGKLDEQQVQTMLVEHQVGAILNTYNAQALPLTQWHTLIKRLQEVATTETRLRIPLLYGIDSIHGATYIQNATLFPHNLGIAATRNPELAFAIAQIAAKETRAAGIRWNFAPVLDVGRDPRWPRFEETFGEDTQLTTQFGLRAIAGYMENGLTHPTAVAPCLKHYLGYSVPRLGKDRTPADIPEIYLREYFLPPFAAAIAAGTPTVMVNSSSINGIPVHADHYLLTTLLKKELGFNGFIVTDWQDIIYLYTQHKIAGSKKEAVKIAINAGNDMSMVPSELSFYHDLLALVKSGEVPMTRIDDAVRRVLRVKFALELFENPDPEPQAQRYFGNPEYKKVALQTARESLTLLKNNQLDGEHNILPLPKTAKVLIVGPAAHNLASLHGSWSYSWTGKEENNYPSTTLTIKEAIAAKIGAERVISPSVRIFDDPANYNRLLA